MDNSNYNPNIDKNTAVSNSQKLKKYIITKNQNEFYYCIEPMLHSYEITLFFFAGFDDKAELFISFWKNVAEELSLYVKIIIPMLPEFKVPSHYSNALQNKSVITAWYVWEEIKLNSKIFKRTPNTQRDELILNLIEKEISYHQNSEKVSLIGFSMGVMGNF
jgi:hypothetical protein